MTFLRGAAFLAGIGALGTAAHATIVATGGYGSAHSFVTLAIAACVAIAAIVIGSAWSADRCGLAVWLGLAIVAGEAFGLLSTAERLIAAREASQAPLRAAAEIYAKAARRVAEASTALARAPTTSPRLEAALAQKRDADVAATEKSSERGCRENCRQLLQARVDAAEREVAAARASLAASDTVANVELDTARNALAHLKPPASATPLADRIGAPAWAIDLVAAALYSIAANGLGCGLIAFAGHRRREADATAVDVTSVDVTPPEPDHAQLFAYDRLFPADRPDSSADVIAIQAAYKRWCAERKIAPLSGAALGQAMADLFERVGIELERREGKLVALGVSLQGEQAAVP